MPESLHLLVDDGYNNSKNLMRADFFPELATQRAARKLRSIVETSIGFAKGFKAIETRNKFSPELQEAIILIVYELA